MEGNLYWKSFKANILKASTARFGVFVVKKENKSCYINYLVFLEVNRLEDKKTKKTESIMKYRRNNWSNYWHVNFVSIKLWPHKILKRTQTIHRLGLKLKPWVESVKGPKPTFGSFYQNLLEDIVIHLQT